MEQKSNYEKWEERQWFLEQSEPEDKSYLLTDPLLDYLCSAGEDDQFIQELGGHRL